MKKLFGLLTALLLLSVPTFAQVIPDGNLLGRPIGGGAGLPVQVPAPTLYASGLSFPTPGFTLQTVTPPTTSTSWLNGNIVGGKNPYGYLASFGELAIISNYGEPAFVGAARTSNTPGPNTCCAIGLVGTGVNDFTTTQESMWPLYLTAARLPGTGSIQNESDIFNFGTLVHVGSYIVNPTGMATNFAVQCGGEPVSAGLTGNHCSAALVIGANGDTYDHGIVFYNNLGTISAVEMALNQRVQWVADSSSGTLAYVTSLVDTAADANSIIFTDFGAMFYQSQTAYVSGNGGLNFQVANNPGVTVVNHLTAQGAATGNPALLFASGSDTNVDIKLLPKATGKVNVSAHLAATTNASDPTPGIASGFGTGPSIAGSDTAGRITVGTGGAASGVINFGAAYGTAPACVANDEVTGNLMRAVASTVNLSIAGTMVAGDTITYICIAYQ